MPLLDFLLPPAILPERAGNESDFVRLEAACVGVETGNGLDVVRICVPHAVRVEVVV